MGVKSEITWRRRTPEGDRCEINARRVGKAWRFYLRQHRFEVWEPIDDPPLADWLELLDGVRRRIARQLLRPEEEPRLQRSIRERFPEVTF
jgi:hypothetical protein